MMRISNRRRRRRRSRSLNCRELEGRG